MTLLDLTRIARASFSSPWNVSMQMPVRDAIEIAGSAIAAKKLHVSAEFDATKAYILGDSIRLQQVFGT